MRAARADAKPSSLSGRSWNRRALRALSSAPVAGGCVGPPAICRAAFRRCLLSRPSVSCPPAACRLPLAACRAIFALLVPLPSCRRHLPPAGAAATCEGIDRLFGRARRLSAFRSLSGRVASRFSPPPPAASRCRNLRSHNSLLAAFARQMSSPILISITRVFRAEAGKLLPNAPQ